VCKTPKLLLLILVFVMILTLPNTIAEGPNDGDENEVLQEKITEDDPERPTLFPDLSISPEDIVIYFENYEDEFFMIIEATITNNGFVGAYANVRFYNGTIERENLICTESLFVKRRDVNTISIWWKVDYGQYKIHVLIGNSVPRELIKRNNAAENTAEFTEYDEGGGGNNQGNDNADDSLGISSISLDNPVVSTGIAGSFLLALFAIANKHYMWLANLGAIPLYTRITNGQVLKQDTRRNIYDYIASNPGAYFSSIMKNLKLKNGVTSYHLAMLEREGYIKSTIMGLYKRFYVNGASTKEFPLSKIRREILKTIVDNPGISQTDIASKLGLSNQVVNYHIGILKEANIIKIVKDGFRTKCFTSSV
jgi:DNA-binding MarR family transcriptional regulator